MAASQVECPCCGGMAVARQIRVSFVLHDGQAVPLERHLKVCNDCSEAYADKEDLRVNAQLVHDLRRKLGLALEAPLHFVPEQTDVQQ